MHQRSIALAALALLATSPLSSAQLQRARPDEVVSQPFVTVAAGTAVDLEGDRAAISSGRGVVIFAEPFVSFRERAPDGSWVLVNHVASPSSSRFFGASVALSGDWAFVGDPGITGVEGRAFGVQFSGGTWSVVGAAVTPPVSAVNDRFGSSVDLSGNRALVGAPGANNTTGAAYVYERDPVTNVWSLVAQLVPSSVSTGDEIGTSVSWANGRAYVGAPKSELAGPDAGAVFVFEETAPGTWTEVQALSGTGAGGQLFGRHIAVDGDLLAVTAPGEPATAAFLPGTTFVHEFDGLTNQWSQIDAVRAPAATDVGFSPTLWQVALEGDDLAGCARG